MALNINRYSEGMKTREVLEIPNDDDSGDDGGGGDSSSHIKEDKKERNNRFCHRRPRGKKGR